MKISIDTDTDAVIDRWKNGMSEFWCYFCLRGSEFYYEMELRLIPTRYVHVCKLNQHLDCASNVPGPTWLHWHVAKICLSRWTMSLYLRLLWSPLLLLIVVNSFYPYYSTIKSITYTRFCNILLKTIIIRGSVILKWIHSTNLPISF